MNTEYTDVSVEPENKNIDCSESEIINSQAQLETWVGDYSFGEVVPPDKVMDYPPYMVMVYTVYVYEDSGKYYANIIIDGFQTMARLRAIVQSDSKFIKLVFDSYLPENVHGIYKEGDILMTWEKEENEIKTYWGEIEAVVIENQESGKVYFVKEAEETSPLAK